jgi:hypothetical protein
MTNPIFERIASAVHALEEPLTEWFRPIARARSALPIDDDRLIVRFDMDAETVEHIFSAFATDATLLARFSVRMSAWPVDRLQTLLCLMANTFRNYGRRAQGLYNSLPHLTNEERREAYRRAVDLEEEAAQFRDEMDDHKFVARIEQTGFLGCHLRDLYALMLVFQRDHALWKAFFDAVMEIQSWK